MIAQIKNWFNKYFSSPELIILLITLFVLVLFFHYLGSILAPVFASIIIAYLLDGMVTRLTSWKVPHVASVIIVWLLFIGIVLVAFLIIFPLVWQQLTSLFSELPGMLKHTESFLLRLPERYPDVFSTSQVHNFINSFQDDLTKLGRTMLKYSISTVFSVLSLIIYCILVPTMVFFFLMDRNKIINWFLGYLPKQRRLVSEVWFEVNNQIGNYIRARILEIIIVAAVASISLSIMGLNYSILLGVLMGLSVLVPYAGAVVVTIPVLSIAFLQWGASTHFVYLIIVYGIIMAIDGNILAPLLFAGATKIHPVAVIVAVIIFGSIWGFWGIFFAIPLAILVKALLHVFKNEESVESLANHE